MVVQAFSWTDLLTAVFCPWQRGELALTLLTHYKDDQDRLARIMDKLLDKEVHQMYKAPSLPTYYINNAPSQVNQSLCLLLHLRRESLLTGVACSVFMWLKMNILIDLSIHVIQEVRD